MRTLHATMNISLDGCCDHTQVIADEEFHDRMVDLFGRAVALVFGRNTYELLHSYWPNVAASGNGTPAEIRLARILDEKPKYVVSSRDPAPGWNARRIEGNADNIAALKTNTNGMVLLVASPRLALALLQWGLVDVYHVAISPIVAGHGPTFLAGLSRPVAATLLSADLLQSGVAIHRYGLTTETVDERRGPAWLRRFPPDLPTFRSDSIQTLSASTSVIRIRPRAI
jgi:dihydrofolate reductase